MGATLEKYWCWWTGSSVTQTHGYRECFASFVELSALRTHHFTSSHGPDGIMHGRRTFKNKLPDMTASYKQLDRGTYRRTQCHSSVMRHGLLTLQMKPTHWAPYNASR